MSTISVHVQRYSISSSSSYSTSHVDYIIQVLYHGRQWFIKKRYSEFDYFHSKISRYYRNLPPLPPKTYRYWGRLSHQIITQRMKGLELYLKEILKIVASDNNLLKEFLEVDEHFLLYYLNSSKTSTEIVNKIDFQQNILKKFISTVLHINTRWRLENCIEISPSKKRFIKSKHAQKKKKKQSTTNTTTSSSSVVNDFRMLSFVSSSNIDIDETESLRDSFRESYLSQSDEKGSGVWKSSPGDDNGDDDDLNEDDLDSLPSLSTRYSTKRYPKGLQDIDDLRNETEKDKEKGKGKRNVIEILSRPISSHSSSYLNLLLSSPSLSSQLSLNFPPLSSLIVTEFHLVETKSPPPSPSKIAKSPTKRRNRKAALVEEEAQALRIRQTKTDSGRDNHLTNSGRGG